MSGPLTLLIALALLIAAPAAAQPPLTESYTAPNGGFSLRHPADWALDYDEARGEIYLRGAGAALTLYNPRTLEDYDLGDGTTLSAVSDPVALARAVLDANDHAAAPVEPITINGRALFRADYPGGLLLVIPLSDGALALIDAYGDLAAAEGAVLAIAASLDRPGVQFPLSLTQPTDWRAATDELSRSGVTPPGGALGFVENYVFFVGRGANLLPLAAAARDQDVAVAGAITYTPGTTADPAESCGLAARISPTGGLVAGIDGGGAAFIAARGGAGDLRPIAAAALDLPAGRYHLLLVARADRANLYVDGRLTLANIRVEPGAGSYGLHHSGATGGTTCEASGIWTYRFAEALATDSAADCAIAADAPVNRRAGPGTGFAVAGILAGGETAAAIAQSRDADGQTWWQLADESWVRADVVRAAGDCPALPVR